MYYDSIQYPREVCDVAYLGPQVLKILATLHERRKDCSISTEVKTPKQYKKLQALLTDVVKIQTLKKFRRFQIFILSALLTKVKTLKQCKKTASSLNRRCQETETITNFGQFWILILAALPDRYVALLGVGVGQGLRHTLSLVVTGPRP